MPSRSVASRRITGFSMSEYPTDGRDSEVHPFDGVAPCRPFGAMPTSMCSRIRGTAERGAARPEPSFRGTSGRSDTGWVSSPSKPGSETLGNGTSATAGRGGRLRHARGYAPPRIHRRGWLARHASRFSGGGARPRTPVPSAAAALRREFSPARPPGLGGGHCAFGFVDAVAHEPCGGSPVQGYQG